MAAEGGEDPFAYKDQDLDYNIDHDDDDEQEVNTTGRFRPGAASTPYQSAASNMKCKL